MKYIYVRMTQQSRKGDFRKLESKNFPEGACPRIPPRSLRLPRSFCCKLVNFFPRSARDWGFLLDLLLFDDNITGFFCAALSSLAIVCMLQFHFP